MRKLKSIKIGADTYAQLDLLKHPGQSIDGVIQELINNKPKGGAN
jgi:predicted CopG family antitoxin